MSGEPSGDGDRLVSLEMYADPPPLRAATRRLWAYLCDDLRAAGLVGVPEVPDETLAYAAAWLDPRLLLAQTCGYPFVKALRGRVRLVATPCYDHPGCTGPSGGSFLVVRAEDPAATIADLAGRRAAINDRASNSGYNLLRAMVAPHAVDGSFFAGTVDTGGHAASLAAVAGGFADVAAIDRVTWGNYWRHAPERLEALRILAVTADTPGLPLITGAATSDAELSLLRAALNRAISDPALAETRATLGLCGFAPLTDADYDVVLAVERAGAGLRI